ncbi:MAG: FAD-binding oxidoreductase [Myxococcota bacterium]
MSASTSTPLQAFLHAVQAAAPHVRISRRSMDRLGYARDASAEAFLERREGALPEGPGAVLWPTSTSDVALIVGEAGRHGVPLAPFGAGSGVVHGTLPTPQWAVMDLKLLDEVSIVPERREVVVGAGVLGERLERALNAAGFSAGHFPSSIYCSTVGGWVAARSAGQLSSRYGKIEDMVVALEAVDGMGRQVRVTHGGGPDLLRVLIGSEGALAVITRVTLRIHPIATHRALFGAAAPDVETGLRFMRRVMQSGLRPAVMRMYDPPDTLIAGGIPSDSAPPEVTAGSIGQAGHEYPFMRGPRNNPPHAVEKPLFEALGRRMRAALKHAVGSGAASPAIRAAVGTALHRTDWLRVPYQALPTSCLVVLGLEGDQEDVTEALACTLELATETGVRVVGRAPGERWLRRRHAITYKMPPFIRAGGWADTLEVSAAWSVLPSLYRETRHALLENAVTLAHFSHAYPDGASIYFTLAGGGTTLEQSQQSHRAAVAAAMRVFSSHSASLSHHHGVGRLKKDLLLTSLGPGAKSALQGLKAAWDPRGVLNPGVLGLTGVDA